jgi:hypothetical protein
MKKKSKDKKKQDMPQFTFKEFTPEEDRVYEEAVNKYREAISAGKKLKEAYDSYAIGDAELRSLIQADFLKIMIAERHFNKNESLEQIADALGAPSELVRDTHARMLQEVGMTAADEFARDTGGITPKTDD